MALLFCIYTYMVFDTEKFGLVKFSSFQNLLVYSSVNFKNKPSMNFVTPKSTQILHYPQFFETFYSNFQFCQNFNFFFLQKDYKSINFE